MQVAGPCGLGDVRVHLKVRVATEPHEGAWRVPLPETFDMVPKVRVGGRPVELDAEDGGVLVPRVKRAPSGRVATLPLSTKGGEHLVRAELDLPTLLRPERPVAFVFVVDRSVSFGAERLGAAWAFIEKVLAEARRGSANAVVTLGRRPQLVVEPWTLANDLAPLRRAREGLSVENGSDLLAAVELAKGVVAKAGAREGRVIVLSDLERPSSISAEELEGMLGRPALTHVVKLDGVMDGGWWERQWPEADDEVGRGTEKSGGVLVRAFLTPDAGQSAELARYLIRPTRLERPHLVAMRGGKRVVASLVEPESAPAGLGGLRELFVDGEGPIDGLVPFDVIPKGGGLRVTGLFTPEVEHEGLTWHVEGAVWSTPARYPLTRRPSTENLLAAVAATFEMGGPFDDEVVRALSAKSGAVSRVSARLVTPTWWPPPSLEGWGATCQACGATPSFGGRAGGASGVARPRILPKPAPKERVAELSAWLSRSREQCGSSSGALRVEFESREILAIEPVGPAGEAERCYSEDLWGLRLDEDKAVKGDAYIARGSVVVPLPGSSRDRK